MESTYFLRLFLLKKKAFIFVSQTFPRYPAILKESNTESIRNLYSGKSTLLFKSLVSVQCFYALEKFLMLTKVAFYCIKTKQ